MKIIVCGAGRVGMSISEHLSTENNDITVIDSNSEALKRITDLYDVQGVLGLASHPAVLKNAGIEDAEMLIAVTESDEINIMACHLSNLLFNIPTKIARIRSREYLNEDLLDLFQEGKIPIDHIISPEEEVASAIVKQWRTPGAFDVAEFCNSHVTMLGILCNSNCPILDTPLRELVDLFPGLNATIMAIIRDNNLIIPRSGDDVLKINDRIYLSCQTDQIERTLAAFGHSEITSHNVIISGAGNLGVMIGDMINKISPDTNLTFIELDKEVARNAAEQLEFASIISGDTLDPEIIKGALFMAVGIFALGIGKRATMVSLRGVGRQMPITFTGFVISGLALIGVPLTAGFISKLYLFKAVFETGNGLFVAIIAISSALSVLYLWKIFEVMWLQEPYQPLKIEKEPAVAYISLWLMVIAIIVFGIYSNGVSSSGILAANALIGAR